MTGTETPLDALYAGPDLHRAAERSRARRSLQDRLNGIRNAAYILSDAAGNRLRRRRESQFELVLAAGESPDFGNRLTAAYAGPGANRAWCLSNVFANYEVTNRIPAKEPADLQRLLRDVQDNVDVLFTEALSRDFYAQSGLTFVSMPAWVKQRVRVFGDWPAQIDALRRATRQETGRILRKYRYGCSVTRKAEDCAHFYDRLYKPYVAQRFGAAAHVVERPAFLKECSRGVLLRVTRENAVLGAALLRPAGRTMAVVWSALDPDREAVHLRGVTDTLDYFSLLYAHLQACRWLDLGPSRPDLFDGTLRYKAKWGAGIHPGLIPQANVFWTCNGRTDGVPDFLRRHAFLIRVAGGLRAVVFVDGDTDTDAFGAKLSAIRTEGVRDYRVVALSRPGERLTEAAGSLGADVTLVDASRYTDVMSAMSGSRAR